jgi:hypothetical protein
VDARGGAGVATGAVRTPIVGLEVVVNLAVGVVGFCVVGFCVVGRCVVGRCVVGLCVVGLEVGGEVTGADPGANREAPFAG